MTTQQLLFKRLIKAELPAAAAYLYEAIKQGRFLPEGSIMHPFFGAGTIDLMKRAECAEELEDVVRDLIEYTPYQFAKLMRDGLANDWKSGLPDLFKLRAEETKFDLYEFWKEEMVDSTLINTHNYLQASPEV